MEQTDRTTKYAKEVLAGNIIAGKCVRLACKRHIDDLKKSKTKAYPYRFNVELGERYLDFFKFLKHSKGAWAGQTLELELWQCFTIGSVFGWAHKQTGLRRFKTAYEQVARKNGKSTKMAGTGLIGLAADGEQGAEVYSAATKRDQAKIIFDEAKRMVNASPSIKKHIEIFQANMNMPATNSKFEPLSADTNSLDGLNISMALIDELHAHKTREMWDVLETATGARQQPLIWTVTTAGFNLLGICYEQYEYANKILEGVIEDDTYFAYIAQLDTEDDPWDEKNWVKANPNLGVSVNLDDLRRKAEKAKEIPAAQNNFFCKHLNMWVNQEVRWMPMDKWRACDEELPELAGKPCYLGIDLSATTDLASIAFEFPLGEGRYAIFSHSFMPEDAIIEKERQDRVPYSAWVNQGYITPTPGNVIDYDWIMSYILEKSKIYVIKEVCYDPWNATQFANNLANEGLTTVEVRQGYRTLSEPTKDVLKLVLEKKLIHGNNPVLTWAANNAVAKLDPAGNIKLDKSKAVQRIDPIMAVVISHVRAMLNPNDVDLNTRILKGQFSF